MSLFVDGDDRPKGCICLVPWNGRPPPCPVHHNHFAAMSFKSSAIVAAASYDMFGYVGKHRAPEGGAR